eukprot:COSAG01_NODE_2586_length_7416_cov_48.667213_4_plen_304_part_00
MWGGAACWATILNANFLAFNMSSTIAWSAVWAVYGPGMFQDEGINAEGETGSQQRQWGPGLIIASQPWSGAFSVTPAAWATAHTTHFTQVGDRYLLAQPGGGSGYLAGGCSYVSFVSPSPSPLPEAAGAAAGDGTAARSAGTLRFTMVIEAADAQYCNSTLDRGGPGGGSRSCANVRKIARAPQTMMIVLHPDLGGRELRVIRSNRTHFFHELPRLAPSVAAAGDERATQRGNASIITMATYNLTIDPGCIYTVTTTLEPQGTAETTRQPRRGQVVSEAPPPPPRPFPLPFREMDLSWKPNPK